MFSKKGECKMEEGEYFTLGSNSGSVFDLKPDVDLLVEFTRNCPQLWSLFIRVRSVTDCPGGNLPHAC